ncbi:unnamed protein product, partial [Brassica rapa subsp. narinosa]
TLSSLHSSRSYLSLSFALANLFSSFFFSIRFTSMHPHDSWAFRIKFSLGSRRIAIFLNMLKQTSRFDYFI